MVQHRICNTEGGRHGCVMCQDLCFERETGDFKGERHSMSRNSKERTGAANRARVSTGIALAMHHTPPLHRSHHHHCTPTTTTIATNATPSTTTTTLKRGILPPSSPSISLIARLPLHSPSVRLLHSHRGLQPSGSGGATLGGGAAVNGRWGEVGWGGVQGWGGVAVQGWGGCAEWWGG